jgi:uncharacterized membrane protein
MTVDTATDPTPPLHLAPPSPPTGRRRLLIAATLLVTFVCGGVVGATSAVYYQSRRGMRMMRMPDDAPRHLLADLQWRLDLDEKQSEDVGKILRAHFDELREMRERHFPEIDESFKKMRTEVASHLNEHQQELWNEHFDRMKGRAFPPPPGRGHGGGRPHHGGPPGERPEFGDHRGPRGEFGPHGDGPPPGAKFQKGKRMKKGPPPDGGPGRRPPRDGDQPAPPHDDSRDDEKGAPHE